VGNDTLSGGSGSDHFRFDSFLNALTNSDTITDFNVAADTIELENVIFGSLTAPAPWPLARSVRAPASARPMPTTSFSTTALRARCTTTPTATAGGGGAVRQPEQRAGVEQCGFSGDLIGGRTCRTCRPGRQANLKSRCMERDNREQRPRAALTAWPSCQLSVNIFVGKRIHRLQHGNSE
jgi:hypothetical protein